MRRLFRRSAALLILAPGVVWTHFLSLFLGRERAIRVCGPFFTLASLPFARNWVPKAESVSDFDNFSARMKKKFRLWEPFFDIAIEQDDDNVFKLNITYCPLCDVIGALGLPGLAPYICEADRQVATENRDKWLFVREHQLATGDPCCDHTYLRKISTA